MAILASNTMLALWQRLAQGEPPQTELYYTNNFTLLIAVMMSAQTTDKAVNKATSGDNGLFAVANSPQSMLALGEAGIANYIKSIGLYKSKARHAIGIAELLLQHHNGEVPAQRAALEALPGVGQKTAGVVLNVAFGQATIPVDTHVFRVARRLGMADASTPNSVEAQLLQNIPEPYLMQAHHRLIMHGRYVCTARAPRCGMCILADLCPSVAV
jgi:endonuclease III